MVDPTLSIRLKTRRRGGAVTTEPTTAPDLPSLKAVALVKAVEQYGWNSPSLGIRSQTSVVDADEDAAALLGAIPVDTQEGT